jgi:hypothetical protein
MGKHGNQDNGQRSDSNHDYAPKHSGGRDGFEWASAQQDTVELPKVEKGKK